MRIESYDVRMDSDRYVKSGKTRTSRIGFFEDITSLEEKPEPRVRDVESVRQQFVLYLWRLLFGDTSAKELSKKYGIDDASVQAAEGLPPKGMSVIKLYGINEYHSIEEENVSFSSRGTVTTSDGRTIDFNVQCDMSSRFEQYYEEETSLVGSMCDPLVLNFTGNVADLSDQHFTFDLDCDGEEESISMLAEGNGFLALDSNNDGIINDGSELFGTSSGDGFKDLAAYDYDHNGWIDENDSIFDKLKIWCKTVSGEDKLMTLKESGVGAIYLNNAQTDFTLRNSLSGQVNGAIKKTGIFLYENAMAGTIVHMDIAKA